MQKNRAYRTYVDSGVLEDYQAFSDLNDMFVKLNSEAYDNYIIGIGQKLRDNPRYFWKYVKSLRNDTGLPRLMSLDEVEAFDDKEKCNLFADFFQSVYIKHDDNFMNVFNNYPTPLFEIDDMVMSSEDIYKELVCLDISKSTGPDGIPNIFMKSVAQSVHLPLQIIFEQSLRHGVFPINWKKSYITPIFKNGSKSDMKNYRGICILSAIPKIFEKLVCQKLTSFLLKTVNQNQHGFVKGRSTETNLTVYLHFLLNSMENGYQIDAIYTDFSKAFDRVHHELLLRKMKINGCPDIMVEWLTSYLSNRTQCVRLGTNLSKDIKVWSGVPQGSHLGPLLFVIFINDLCDLLTGCKFLFYADDLKIFMRVKDLNDTMELQNNLNIVNLWCKKNYMELNVLKCKCISYSRKQNLNQIVYNYEIDGVAIGRCKVMNDLGVLIDDKLNMNEHVDFIVNRAKRLLGFVKRQAKCFSDPYVSKALYCSLVRPLLDYCATSWNPFTCTQIERIESIQKQFLLFALRNLGWNHVFELPS